MDPEEHLIIIYVVCDECLKLLNYRDDPQCRMSTAEVMTTSVFAATFGYGNLSRSCAILKMSGHIPQMLSVSRFCRRWNKIGEEVWKFVLHFLYQLLKPFIESPYFAVDSFPAPACQTYKSRICKRYKGKQFLGFCASKKLHYYGLKVHLVVSEHGNIVDFSFTPASVNDVRAFSWINFVLPHNSVICADKAYTSYMVEDWLLEQENISLLPLRRRNLKRQHSFETEQEIKCRRWGVETAISVIQCLFPKSIVARTQAGFERKLALFIIGKSFRDLSKQLAGE